jgi:hypothetical protein
MEIGEVRKRLKAALDEARRNAAERRTRIDAAARAYEVFLEGVATPVFKMVAAALKAEGRPFKVFTPAGGLRLMSEHSAEDSIELTLDTSPSMPIVMARINRGRGHRVLSSERPIRDAPVEQLTQEDVLRFLLEEIPGLVER